MVGLGAVDMSVSGVDNLYPKTSRMAQERRRVESGGIGSPRKLNVLRPF